MTVAPNSTAAAVQVASLQSAMVAIAFAPPAPTGAMGVVGNGQVTLNWAAPSNNGGNLVKDYLIQYSSDNGSTWSLFRDETSTATTAIVTGLRNGTSYVFSVAAVNDVGAGRWSPPSTPIAPSSVSAVVIDRQLRINLAGAGDIASLSNNGKDYVITGMKRGGSGQVFTASFFSTSGVDSIFVIGTSASDSQAFVLGRGTLIDSLLVDKSVEETNLCGTVQIAQGGVAIGSSQILLSGMFSSSGSQRYSGNVVLVDDISLTTADTILFGGTIEGGHNLTLAAKNAVTFTGSVGSKQALGEINVVRAASVTAQGRFTLDGSISGAGPHGLRFGAGVNNVRLWSSGSTIRNFSSAGIRFDGTSTNSLIHGFTIDRNGWDGIQLDSGNYQGTVIEGNTVTNNSQVGIRACGTIGLIISNNTVSANGTGIAVTNSNGSVEGTNVRGNVVTKNGDGIVLGPSAQGITIGGIRPQDGNTFQSNKAYGIKIEPGNYARTVIQGNKILANGGAGIRGNQGGARGMLIGAADIGGGGNSITGNGWDGIQFDIGDYAGTRINGNTVADNTHVGIRGSSTTNLTINGNNVSGSGSGFAFSGTMAGTSVRANTISRNGDGISLWTGVRGLTIGGSTSSAGNTVSKNFRDGFSIDSGNYTGTVIHGNSVLGNSRDGVRFNEGPGATALAFGGLGVGEGNSIQGNGGNGVSLSAGDYRGAYASTAIIGNRLWDNGGIAIHRPPAAINVIVTPNDVFNITDYQYSQNATGITITKYKGTATDVTVPQLINGVRVTELGIGAFQGRGDITRVTLPQGLTRIGNNAFDGCRSLVSVNIPNGVTSIGDTAFIWCGKLQTLNIPASVTSIGIFWSFWGCGSMTSINVDPANTKYASQDGILYNKDMTWLYWCPGGKAGAVTLASTVKTIGYFSFEDCNRITSITIPASVTLIEDGVFDKCTNLRSFYFLGNAPTVRSSFDPSVKATAYYMSGTKGWSAALGGVPTQLFVGQTADYTYAITNTGISITKYTGTATDVTVPQFMNGLRVTEIGNSAFARRWDITRVTLPQGITRIGSDAFNACDRLTSISIPAGVREIGSGAFIWCGKLQTLNIPASVTSIPIFWTFWGCSSLTSINVDPANTKYASQDGILYNQDKTWLYWCPGGKAGDVKLAPTVKTIGYFSFENCNRITSITIPASVTLIEDGVFDKCTNLRSFYFLGNAPTVRSSFDLSVKATAYYLRGTLGWGTTLGGVPTAMTPTAPTNPIGTAGNVIVRPLVNTIIAERVELAWSAPGSDGNAR